MSDDPFWIFVTLFTLGIPVVLWLRAKSKAKAGAGKESQPPTLPPAVGPESVPAARTRVPGLKLKYGGVRHRVTKADGEIMIGRDVDANILVNAPHVSRHHASIIWDDEGYPLIVNLSKSGTSLKIDGQSEPVSFSSSTRLEGEGRIGLAEDFAYAEAQQTVVIYELKGGARSA
jgi:hypothetical protein